MSALLAFVFLFAAVDAPAADNQPDEKHPGGPQLGSPGGGPVIDKTGDQTLQKMIAELEPKFSKLIYRDDKTDKHLHYNLFIPEKMKEGEKYPLLLFMADASTPGPDIRRPLTQGYGALVWAEPEFQSTNPCYVLVPQFSGVAVNDAYQHTEEVEMVMKLVRNLLAGKNIDQSRLYVTGQSMGGMISMYFNIAYPDFFAASLFVDCHWDPAGFTTLAGETFTYITAGENGKSFKNIQELERAVEKAGRSFAYARWSAKLPEKEQDRLADELYARNAPINIINFTPKSVLPEDGKGSEHMYSFDYAYKLAPVRQWLFRQSRQSEQQEQD